MSRGVVTEVTKAGFCHFCHPFPWVFFGGDSLKPIRKGTFSGSRSVAFATYILAPTLGTHTAEYTASSSTSSPAEPEPSEGGNEHWINQGDAQPMADRKSRQTIVIVGGYSRCLHLFQASALLDHRLNATPNDRKHNPVLGDLPLIAHAPASWNDQGAAFFLVFVNGFIEDVVERLDFAFYTAAVLYLIVKTNHSYKRQSNNRP